ncbi:uncharacterized protein LOC136074046 [Hydra vulgaris]|uniref:Uncharacterized protein LOC136074046 n=1 Tax=Hydra vulgaris TaxID=6087 RepID=A0ABM4B0W0_HYDVU
MAKGVANSEIILLLISEEYEKSENCISEYTYAKSCNKNVIPIQVKDYLPPRGSGLSLIIAGKIYYQLYENKEENMKRIVKEIENYIGKRFSIKETKEAYAKDSLEDGLIKLCSTVINGRVVTLTWKPPNRTSKRSNLESYILKYKKSKKEVKWMSISLSKEENSYVFDQLLFGTEYSFKILGVYDRYRKYLLTETIFQKTVELDVPQIISVCKKPIQIKKPIIYAKVAMFIQPRNMITLIQINFIKQKHF